MIFFNVGARQQLLRECMQSEASIGPPRHVPTSLPYFFFVGIKPENPYLASRSGLEVNPLGVYPCGPRTTELFQGGGGWRENTRDVWSLWMRNNIERHSKIFVRSRD